MFRELIVESARRDVTIAGKAVPLTRTKFDIPDALSAGPRDAFSGRQLLDEVRDAGWVGDDHIVDMHIGHIRRKLGDEGDSARYIETVPGVGYRMGHG